MAWESIGSIGTGQMPHDESWILMSLGLARTYVAFVCGDPPAGSTLEVMWHEHELGSYPSLGVWSDYEHPWEYIHACERALEAFDRAVSWADLKDYMEQQLADRDEDDEEAEAQPAPLPPAALESLAAFKARAARCAQAMLDNASYVQRELPSLELAPPYREQVLAVCASLVGTKHDVVTELDELEDEDVAADPAAVRRRVLRIVEWTGSEIPRLHEAVKALEDAAAAEHGVRPAYLLVAESATNFLMAFNSMSDAAERFLEDAKGEEEG